MMWHGRKGWIIPETFADLIPQILLGDVRPVGRNAYRNWNISDGQRGEWDMAWDAGMKFWERKWPDWKSPILCRLQELVLWGSLLIPCRNPRGIHSRNELPDKAPQISRDAEMTINFFFERSSQEGGRQRGRHDGSTGTHLEILLSA